MFSFQISSNYRGQRDPEVKTKKNVVVCRCEQLNFHADEGHLIKSINGERTRLIVINDLQG
jgi:hypothetical protein